MQVKAGYTMFEVLLVMALVAALFSFSVPVLRNFQLNSGLNSTVDVVVQTLRRAQALSLGGSGDSSWGVDFRQSSVTLFKGNSYASRDATFDEVFDISSSVQFSGPSEIVFSKITGLPSTTGTIVLLVASGHTKSVSVNSSGSVDY